MANSVDIDQSSLICVDTSSFKNLGSLGLSHFEGFT